MYKTTIIFIGTPEAFKTFRGSFAANISTVQYKLVTELYLLEEAILTVNKSGRFMLPVLFHESAKQLPEDIVNEMIIFTNNYAYE